MDMKSRVLQQNFYLVTTQGKLSKKKYLLNI